MEENKTLWIADTAKLSDPRTRRHFLKLMGLGGAIVFLPAVMTACKDDVVVNPPTGGGNTLTPGAGPAVTIDFANGDIAVLQFAFALEQLEADFYTRAVAGAGSAGYSTAEMQVLEDVKGHEITHRDFLKSTLGGNGQFTLTPTYPGVDFGNRMSVLTTAKTFEDLGVAAYNGAAQYLKDVNYLLVAGKIVSVEARHASAIRDLLAPKTGDFAPQSFDDAFSPGKVATAAQGFIYDKVVLGNAPTTFVQGPNGNG